MSQVHQPPASTLAPPAVTPPQQSVSSDDLGEVCCEEQAAAWDLQCSYGNASAQGFGQGQSVPDDDPGVCEVPTLDDLLAAIQAGGLGAILAVYDELEPEDRALVATDDLILSAVATSLGLPEAVQLLDAFGADTVDVMFLWGLEPMLAAACTSDGALAALLARHVDGPLALAPFLVGQDLALFMVAYGVPIQDQLDQAGLYGTPAWDLFLQVIDLAAEPDRQASLEEVRLLGLWEDLIASLGPEHVALVQGWLEEDAGDETGQTLDERVAAALNSARGADAMARVDGVAATDTHQPERITDRVRELLVLGVALPRLEGNDLASEGVMGAVQAERAAQALVLMPDEEYLRTLLLLELTGDVSRLNQSFLVLKAVAARLDRFQNADAADDELSDIEDFCDDIRGMTDEEVVQNTSVLQTQPGQLGLRQRFTMSCNVTSGLAVRAEADPVEALQIHQDDELGVDQLEGNVASETEQGLENHGGNVAVARDTSRVVNAVNAAVAALAGTTPAAELIAVINYINRVAYVAADYQAGIVAVRNQINQGGFPDDQAMRLVREADPAAAQPGLTPEELRDEMNGTLGVDDVTGQTAAVDWDATLWALYTADNDGDGVADRLVPNPVPAAWTTRISQLLGRADTTLESGVDVTFNVYWDGGGGHTMSFSDVRQVGGVQQFLVHDTWSGNTAWVPEASIQQGSWPGITGNRGVICGLIG